MFLWAGHVPAIMTPTTGDDEDGPAGSSAGPEGGGPPWDEEMAPGRAGEGADRGADGAAEDESDGAADHESDGDVEDESDGDGVAGEFVPEGPVEAEEPVLEHAVAMLFGAMLTILAVGELAVADYGLETMAILAGATVAVGVVLFGYFGLLGDLRTVIDDRTI